MNSEMANCCTLFFIRHSPKVSQIPGTKGLVEVQSENHGTHLRMFLQDTL